MPRAASGRGEPPRAGRAGKNVPSGSQCRKINSDTFQSVPRIRASPCETSTSMTDAAHVSARAARRWSLGHPWIFRSDVTVRPEGPAGAVVVLDHRGKTIGTALWSPASEIALRMVDARPARRPRPGLVARADPDRRPAPSAARQRHERVSRGSRRGGRMPVARLRPLRPMAGRAAAERRPRGVSRPHRRGAVRRALARRAFSPATTFR